MTAAMQLGSVGQAAALHVAQNKNLLIGFVSEIEKLFLVSSVVMLDGGAGSSSPGVSQQHLASSSSPLPHQPASAASPTQQQQHGNGADHHHQQQTVTTRLAPPNAMFEVKQLLTAVKKSLTSSAVSGVSVGIVGGGVSFGNAQTTAAAVRMLDVVSVICTILHASMM